MQQDLIRILPLSSFGLKNDKHKSEYDYSIKMDFNYLQIRQAKVEVISNE